MNTGGAAVEMNGVCGVKSYFLRHRKHQTTNKWFGTFFEIII